MKAEDDSRNADEVLDAWRRAPDDAELAEEVVLLGLVQNRLDEFATAVTALERSGRKRPSSCRLLALAALRQGKGDGARTWAERHLELEPGQRSWRLLAAACTLQRDAARLRHSLTQLVMLGDSDALKPLRFLESHPHKRFPQELAEPLLEVEELATPSTRATLAVVTEDDEELVAALAEQLQIRNRTEAVALLAELIRKLLPFVPEAASRPRKLIGWVNHTFDVHLIIPPPLLHEACEKLHADGRAAWHRAEGILLLRGDTPPEAPPPPPQVSTAGPLEFLRGTSNEETQTTATLTLQQPDETASTLTIAPAKDLASTALAELRPGSRLGNLEVVALAGRGGMGSVYQVKDPRGQRFALKTVRTARESHRAALERELALLQLVNRADYFPTVQRHFPAGDQLVVVMDWIEGVTLDTWLTRERLQQVDAPTFLGLMTQLGDRLGYLHTWQGHGILFRDLKPKNILVDPTTLRLKLVDFGISHLGAPDELVKAGTPRYLAPEVRQGRATVRTDLYSLGRVGLFLLFGHEEFDTVAADHRVPLMVERGIPQALVEACTRLSAFEPAKRPPDVHAALDLLQDALRRDDDTAAVPTGEACPTCRSALLRKGLFCPTCGASLTTPPPSGAPVRLRVEKLGVDVLSPAGHRSTATYEALLQMRAASDLTQLRCLPYIDVQPYDYQRRAAVEVLSRMGARALVADDVGLGKTIEAGLVLKEQLIRGLARRCLLVSPPGVLLDQLREEMRSKFALDFVQYQTNGDALSGCCGPRTVKDRDLVIVSKALISRDTFAPLLNVDWDVLVVDECHHFKNRAAKGWRNLRRISARARSVILLSATPFSGDPDELYALYSFLDPGYLGASVAEFRRDYLVGGRGRGNRMRPTKQLKLRVGQYTIRRRRRDIGGGIAFPGREAVRVPVRMSPDERRLYDRALVQVGHLDNGLARTQALQQLASSWESLVEGATGRALPHDLRTELRRLGDGAHPKVRALLDRVLPKLPAREKVLVFTRYRASQQALLRLIRQRNIRADALVGQSPKDRSLTVRRFKEDPDLRVLVCGEGAGEGLNLQFCSILVNFDLPWNPMRVEQRIGRIQRLGQPRQRVSVVNLVLRATVEERILDVLEQKLEIFKLFMGETEQILGEALEDGSFESWVASAIQSDGHVDEQRFRQIERDLERAAKRVKQREEEAGSQADDFIGTWGPEIGEGAPRPDKPSLNLDFLEDEEGDDW